MKKYFVVLFLHFIINSSFAQDHVSVSGIVIDTISLKKIEYATIQLVDYQTCKMKYGIITDSLGRFCINKVFTQKYYIIASFIGYKTKKTILIVTAKDKFNLKISLNPTHIDLGSVEIKGKQEGIKSYVDKTVFLPDSLSIHLSATALDLLNKAPGISVSKSDQTIRLMGNPNVLILIDGVQSNRNLMAVNPEDIERIEIINNPSSKYDSDVVNVINIIIKDERKKGFSITTNLSWFSQNKYNFSNIQFDYIFGKFHVFGMYKLKLSNIYSKDSLRRIANVNEIISENFSESKDRNHNKSIGNIIQYGFDYYPNKSNLFNFTGNLEMYKNISNYNNSSLYTKNYTPIHAVNYLLDKDGEVKLQNYSFYYKRKFKNDDYEFAFSNNIYLMQKEFANKQNTSFNYFIDSTYTYSIKNEISKNQINALNSTLNFRFPLISQKLKAETGIQLYYRKITDNYFDGLMNFRFNYIDIRKSIYSVITYYQNKWSCQAGIRGENYGINLFDSITYSQWNYLPSFSVMFDINNSQKIKLGFSKKLNYPKYFMLSPFAWYSNDSLSVSTGNPYLKPEKSYNIEITYILKKKKTLLTLSQYIKHYNDLIDLNSIYGGKSVLQEKYENINYNYRIGGSLYLQTLLYGFIQPSIFADVFYYNFPKNNNNGFSYNMWVSAEFVLPFDLYLNVDASFSGKELFYNGYAEQSPLIDEITIGKDILNGNANISLSLLNYFLPNLNKETRWSNDFSENSYYFSDNKSVLLRFSYFFRKGKKIDKMERELNMERDEK